MSSVRTEATSSGIGYNEHPPSPAAQPADAAAAVLTLAGVNLVVMINAAVIIEVIFAWPGIGRLLYEGIFQRDFPLVQGVVMQAGIMIVFINLIIDLLYAYIDPRIRLTK